MTKLTGWISCRKRTRVRINARVLHESARRLSIWAAVPRSERRGWSHSSYKEVIASSSSSEPAKQPASSSTGNRVPIKYYSDSITASPFGGPSLELASQLRLPAWAIHSSTYLYIHLYYCGKLTTFIRVQFSIIDNIYTLSLSSVFVIYAVRRGANRPVDISYFPDYI